MEKLYDYIFNKICLNLNKITNIYIADEDIRR